MNILIIAKGLFIISAKNDIRIMTIILQMIMLPENILSVINTMRYFLNTSKAPYIYIYKFLK